MATAMGHLKWTPEQFLKSSYFPYSCAMNGYLAALGASDDNDAMTRDEYLELKKARTRGQ